MANFLIVIINYIILDNTPSADLLNPEEKKKNYFIPLEL